MLPLALFFSGCSQKSQLSASEELNLYFDKLNLNALDVSFSTTVTIDSISETIETRMKVFGNEQEQKIYINMSDDENYLEVYFVDGYSYVDENGCVYTEPILVETFTEMYNANFIDIDKINLSEVMTTKSKSDKFITYVININEIDLNEILDEVAGLNQINLGIGNFIMEVVVDTKNQSNNIKKIKISLDFYIEDEFMNIVLDFEINAVNNQVQIEIPQNVAEAIDTHKFFIDPSIQWDFNNPPQAQEFVLDTSNQIKFSKTTWFTITPKTDCVYRFYSSYSFNNSIRIGKLYDENFQLLKSASGYTLNTSPDFNFYYTLKANKTYYLLATVKNGFGSRTEILGFIDSAPSRINAVPQGNMCSLNINEDYIIGDVSYNYFAFTTGESSLYSFTFSAVDSKSFAYNLYTTEFNYIINNYHLYTNVPYKMNLEPNTSYYMNIAINKDNCLTVRYEDLNNPFSNALSMQPELAVSLPNFENIFSFSVSESSQYKIVETGGVDYPYFLVMYYYDSNFNRLNNTYSFYLDITAGETYYLEVFVLSKDFDHPYENTPLITLVKLN